MEYFGFICAASFGGYGHSSHWPNDGGGENTPTSELMNCINGWTLIALKYVFIGSIRWDAPSNGQYPGIAHHFGIPKEYSTNLTEFRLSIRSRSQMKLVQKLITVFPQLVALGLPFLRDPPWGMIIKRKASTTKGRGGGNRGNTVIEEIQY